MRLVFIGSSEFGLRCVEKCIALPEVDLVGIITNPEAFSISYSPNGVRNVRHADFLPFAEQYGIPLCSMTGKMTDESIVSRVKLWAPAFILVAGWYHMIPKVIREIAPTGGLHASLLPDYSGGAPLVWAIINGEKETGITFFLMDSGVDSGPIIGQVAESITPQDTIATLYERIEHCGVRLIQECLPKIARGEMSYTPQNESRRRVMPQRSPGDGEINWFWPAHRIYDFVRAQTKPYPGAFTFLDAEKVTVWTAGLPRDNPIVRGSPGELIRISADCKQALLICCGDGMVLSVSEVGLSSGIEMTGMAFARELNISPGALLGESE